MRKQGFGLLMFGALVLSACGQNPSAPAQSAPETATEASATPSTFLSATEREALQAQLAELRQLRADVAAGRTAAPLTDEGQAIDLDALIASFEADLQQGVAPLNIEVPNDTLGAQAAPYPQSTYTAIAATDVFRNNYNFYRSRYARFNWGNDGCSGPAKFTGWSDEFFWPCVQHDFGYRNARLYPRLLNENHRAWIDGQFKQHMRQKCATLGWRKYACYVAAEGFWAAVRHGGRGSFYP